MFLSIITFILVLSLLVLVHEFGHFMTAKKAGVLVEEFGIGLPPMLFGKKIGETLYSVNALPFGGFVRLHGENLEEEITDKKRAFLGKSKKIRAGIILAGVVMNFLLAIVCFSIVYSFSGIPRKTNNVKIIDVVAGSPAQVAGVLPGDYILKVDSEAIGDSAKFMSEIDARKGEKISLEVRRDSEVKTIKLTPRDNPPENEGPLGVVITSTEIYFPPLWQRPFIGIKYGFGDAVFWGKTVLLGMGTMIGQLFKGVVPKDVSGPVGIFAVTSEAAKHGILSLINFIGILSVNLAILNVLPFPALDGGRLLFIFLEKLLGRKVLPKVENAIHAAGMIFLLAMIALITFYDVKRLIAAGSIVKFLESMVK